MCHVRRWTLPLSSLGEAAGPGSIAQASAICYRPSVRSEFIITAGRGANHGSEDSFVARVKAANPTLPDEQMSYMIDRAIKQERELVLRHGLHLNEAREIANAELFPTRDDDTDPETPD